MRGRAAYPPPCFTRQRGGPGPGTRDLGPRADGVPQFGLPRSDGVPLFGLPRADGVPRLGGGEAVGARGRAMGAGSGPDP